jgi:hypothetical protein
MRMTRDEEHATGLFRDGMGKWFFLSGIELIVPGRWEEMGE